MWYGRVILYESKRCAKSAAAGIRDDRGFAASSGVFALSVWSEGERDLYGHCTCLYPLLFAGKCVKTQKDLWGMAVGFAYFLLLIGVSWFVEKQIDMSVQHMITTFCMCLAGGTLGGMISWKVLGRYFCHWEPKKILWKIEKVWYTYHVIVLFHGK